MQDRETFYFDIPKQERDSCISYLLSMLLKSRTACQLPSNDQRFDEDVNIYLAHLLFAASLPDYQNAVRRYLAKNVSEITDLIERNEDRIVRYFIYKVNADHLMIHLGLFQNFENSHQLYGKTEQQFCSMARNFYKQAATYNRKIYRRVTAVGSVLEKLADGFDRYQTILRYARKEFFNFSNHFHDEPFQKFCQDLKRFERESKLNEAIDQFLDSYVEWIKGKDAKSKSSLMNYAQKLQSIDPNFVFRLNSGSKEAA